MKMINFKKKNILIILLLGLFLGLSGYVFVSFTNIDKAVGARNPDEKEKEKLAQQNQSAFFRVIVNI